MSNVWESFWSGESNGERVGGQIRNARAFRSGGLPAVAEAAGRNGDLTTYGTATGMQDQQRTRALQWFQQNAPYARNILRQARQITDPTRRRQYLESNRSRFEGMGFDAQHIDAAIQGLTDVAPLQDASASAPAQSAAPLDSSLPGNPASTQPQGALPAPATGGRTVADEWFDNLDAAFSQHQDPNWQVSTVTGDIYSVDPNTGKPMLGGEAPGSDLYRARTDAQIWHLRHPSAGRGAAGSYGAPSLPNGYQWDDGQ